MTTNKSVSTVHLFDVLFVLLSFCIGQVDHFLLFGLLYFEQSSM